MSGPSRNALERLIARRLEPDADVESIDRIIEKRFTERWAVVFTDLVGFSRRTRDFGIIHFLTVIYRKGLLLKPVLDEEGGLLLKEEADSWLIAFRDPVHAVQTMIRCQGICEAYNAGVEEKDRVELCVGAGYGDVLKIGDEDIWGKEVNLASKLGEDIARRGEILVTPSLATELEGALPGTSLEHRDASFGELGLPHYSLKYTLPTND